MPTEQTSIRSLTLDSPVGAGVLGATGATPLVRLERLFPEAPFEVYAKLEHLNPAGSIKDRAAVTILTRAFQRGDISKGSMIVESSSGNMAIALAQAAICFGLRFIAVVDPRTTKQNLALLRAYGADVDVVTEPDDATGEFLPARLRRARELTRVVPDAFWINQYANLDHPAAHWATLAELESVLDGRIDYLFCAVGTCGFLRGAHEYLRAHGRLTTIVAVDAVGSAIFSDVSCRRLIPGHGAAVIPALYREGLADAVVCVSDLDCVRGCRKLAAREGIIAGGSSGAVVAALESFHDRIREGAHVVCIVADRGERYLDTIYSDEWVEQFLDP